MIIEDKNQMLLRQFLNDYKDAVWNGDWNTGMNQLKLISAMTSPMTYNAVKTIAEGIGLIVHYESYEIALQWDDFTKYVVELAFSPDTVNFYLYRHDDPDAECIMDAALDWQTCHALVQRLAPVQVNYRKFVECDYPVWVQVESDKAGNRRDLLVMYPEE